MIRRTRRLAAALTVLAVVAVAPMAAASAAFAQSSGSSGSDAGEVLATLKVTADKVEVRKDGAEKFKEAKDGAKLRQGDTVRTNATGLAEIDYSESAYTRLDVSTTFTIKKLTDDQGSRQVQGSLEQGQAWNRTEAITESGSFGTDGAGANATVRGTAYNVQCDSADHCVFTAIYHDTELTGIDGSTKLLNPLDQCESNDTDAAATGLTGELCAAVSHLTLSEALANKWIQDNLLKDLLEHGFGPGPFSGTLVVHEGQLFFVPDTPATTTSDTVAPPVVDGILVPDYGCTSVGSTVCSTAGTASATGYVPADPQGIITVSCDYYGCGYQLFRANILSPTDLSGVHIVFTSLPGNGDIGYDCADGEAIQCGGWLGSDDVTNASQFAASTVFGFVPTGYFDDSLASDVQPTGGSDSFTFVATNSGGSSAEQSVETVVNDYTGCSLDDAHAAC